MNSFNRLFFLAIGLALVAAGIYAGLLGTDLIDTAVLDEVRDEVLAINWADQMVRIIALALGALGALLALIALIREVLPPRPADPMITIAESGRGSTRVSKSALRRAYEHAAGAPEGVARARVERLEIDGDGVHVALETRLDGGHSVASVGAEVLRRSAGVVQQTFPDRPTRVDAVIELTHGRRARKRTRRVQ